MNEMTIIYKKKLRLKLPSINKSGRVQKIHLL